MGRSIATSKRNKIDRFRFEQMAIQIKHLHTHGIAVVLVVSAAVCCGEQELGLKGQYNTAKSLVAGVGQATVMAELYNIFNKHNLKIGQLLVTKADLENSQKRTSMRNVFKHAMDQHITLIVNENDIIELHSFEGNDYLSTEIANLIQADSLLLLTDVEGVLNEQMVVIKNYAGNENFAQIAKENYKGEVGGMKAKLDAAMKAASNGTATWISSGKTQNLLTRIFLQQEHVGTRVLGGAL